MLHLFQLTFKVLVVGINVTLKSITIQQYPLQLLTGVRLTFLHLGLTVVNFREQKFIFS